MSFYLERHRASGPRAPPAVTRTTLSQDQVAYAAPEGNAFLRPGQDCKNPASPQAARGSAAILSTTSSSRRRERRLRLRASRTVLAGRARDIVGSLLRLPPRHRHLSRPLPVPAPQPPVRETALIQARGGVPAWGRHRGGQRGAQPGGNIWVGAGVVARMSRCEAHDLLTTTDELCPRRVVGEKPHLPRAASAVASSGRPEREGRCGRSAARARGGVTAAPLRAAMTRDLHHVCAPTPLRRASLDALETPSHRRGVPARSMREIDPRARRSRGHGPYTLRPERLPRAPSASVHALPDAGSPRSAGRTAPASSPSMAHHFIEARSTVGWRDAGAPEGPCFAGDLRAALVGSRALARPRLAACISIILRSQNVAQYTKSTRDCLHELATLLFSISGKLCIGYAE